MPITPVTLDSDQEDDLAFVEDVEEGTSYTFAELLRSVQAHNDIIITIPADQDAALRKGLAARKTRDTAKVKSAGIVADSSVLTFLSYPHKDQNGNEVTGWLDVRIKLGPRRSITVREMRIPSDTL